MAAAAAASKGGRILVVDDDPMVRETLGQMLADEGYVVDTAIDGADALVRVRTARPDAILLDLMMPGMNGRQFLHALRDDAAYEAVRVLIMTAVHGLEINLTMIGASDIVEKPFNADELLNKVALAVYRSREADRLANVPFSPAPAEVTSTSTSEPSERGVVLVVEHDRSRLQQLDLLLSERGYTVVSMTRAMAQLSRLARALRPRAILLELSSDGVTDVVHELRAEQGLARIPILVFARDAVSGERHHETLEHASDLDLVGFVERQR